METNVQVKWMLLRVVYHKHKSHTFTYFCHSNWLFACSYLKNLDAIFLLKGSIAEVICVTLYKLVFFHICRNDTSYKTHSAYIKYIGNFLTGVFMKRLNQTESPVSVFCNFEPVFTAWPCKALCKKSMLEIPVYCT